MRALRAIIVDSFLREVREAEIYRDLEEFQRICGGHHIEFGVWINGQDCPLRQRFRALARILRDRRAPFLLRHRSHTGGDARGKNMSKSARVPLSDIRGVVRFGVAKAK
jgi:hypothetical protein